MTVYFATNSEFPALTPDDQLLLVEVQDMGLDTQILDWHDSQVRPGIGDVVVIRSCWDYHLHLEEFRRWLRSLQAGGALVANTSRTVLDTLDKRYLLALRDAGVARIPSTIIIPMGSTVGLDALIDEIGANGLVAKPMVSLNSYNTVRIDATPTPDQRAQVQALARESDLLVQSFLPEISTQGELSLIFIGGRFSHAVRKRPAEGDFRVQSDFGGTVEPVEVDAPVISEALRCLNAVNASSIYARVDGVLVFGRFTLMEIELIDPVLFLGMHPPAAGLLAGEIAFMASMATPVSLHKDAPVPEVSGEPA